MVVLVFGSAGCDVDAPSALPDVVSVAHGARPGTVLVQTEDIDDVRDQYLVVDVDGHIVAAGTPTRQPVLTEDCAGDDCYRVAQWSMEVDESHGATRAYRSAWSVTGVQYQRLVWSYYQSGAPELNVSSKSVVVLSAPDGHVVFVANRRDGLLYRDVGGGWHRLGTPRFTTVGTRTTSVFYPPTPLPVPLPRNPRLEVAAVFSVMLVLVAVLVCAWRRLRPGLLQTGGIVAIGGFEAWASAAVTTHYTQGRDLVFIDGLPVLTMMFVIGLLAAVTVLTGRPFRRSG